MFSYSSSLGLTLLFIEEGYKRSPTVVGYHGLGHQSSGLAAEGSGMAREQRRGGEVTDGCLGALEIACVARSGHRDDLSSACAIVKMERLAWGLVVCWPKPRAHCKIMAR